MVLNPFVASFHPARQREERPLRLLPVELTLLNDLPSTPSRSARAVVRRHPGQGDPGFLVYFLDDNAYGARRTRASGRAAIRAPNS